jgi:predicted acyltransferase
MDLSLNIYRDMEAKAFNQDSSIAERMFSIDFFRGFTMFLLIGESTRLYSHIRKIDTGLTQFIGTQLEHHEWHGLYFWDLIQPFFMFIVGVAIPFAVANRIKKGEGDRTITLHAYKRAFLLFFLGWALYWIGPGKIVFRLQDVLTQLSVTYLVAFLIRNKSFWFQMSLSLAILLIMDLAYRFFPVEGFNQPWVAYQNLGAWANIKIEGVEKTSIWASINAFSTIAHTVWGVLCGKLLMSSKPAGEKIKLLLIAGVAGLIIGYSLDILNITPIIKKIATASFVFTSGGYAILALTFSYWLIDVKKIFVNGSKMFRIVGMNCIFIYVFFESGGAGLVYRILTPLPVTLFSWAGEITVGIVTSIMVWTTLWYLCYWLYKNKLFIKI